MDVWRYSSTPGAHLHGSDSKSRIGSNRLWQLCDIRPNKRFLWNTLYRRRSARHGATHNVTRHSAQFCFQFITLFALLCNIAIMHNVRPLYINGLSIFAIEKKAQFCFITFWLVLQPCCCGLAAISDDFCFWYIRRMIEVYYGDTLLPPVFIAHRFPARPFIYRSHSLSTHHFYMHFFFIVSQNEQKFILWSNKLMVHFFSRTLLSCRTFFALVAMQLCQ